MDTQKFGAFVAARRKELGLTQAELAAKIQVTDKAVSRWERGVGFPDITSLEPLAQALELSVVELMKSERIQTESMPVEEATAVLTDSLATTDRAGRKKRKRRRTLLGVIAGVLVAVCLWVFWLYWHPRIVIPYSGKLSGPPVVAVGTYFGLPIPDVIRDRNQLWQSRVAGQYLSLLADCEEWDVDYETYYQSGYTWIHFTGTAVKQDGERLPVDFLDCLAFRLYGVPERAE